MVTSQTTSGNAGPVLVEIDDGRAGQRLDNFLLSQLKGVPRTRIYKLVRSGEVRVNKGRKQASYRLVDGDVVRIPPVRTAEAAPAPKVSDSQIDQFGSWILYEDTHLLAINKPAGLAVHGGSGLSYGLIELARIARPELKHLELVHRLDRDTSGVILLAKRRSALRALHESLRNRTAHKTYWALVSGMWPARKQQVKLNLSRDVLRSGERMASVD
ncbi:MAG: pseudouridine synthase, partial [Litorivicinus sp.]